MQRLSSAAALRRPPSGVRSPAQEFVCTDENYAIELDYLKQKCDAGGDVIITQLFYDFEVFKAWVQDLRDAGITAPIFPGGHAAQYLLPRDHPRPPELVRE